MTEGSSSDEPVPTREGHSAAADATPAPPLPGPPAPSGGPPETAAANAAGYALRVANGSYDWYHRAALRARRFFRITETLVLLVSAAIPVSAVLAAGNAEVPAVLGGIVVVITGLRSVFHWQDDYLRFSEAREAVEAERRLYYTGAEPYADPGTRDQVLTASITRIEQREMGSWAQLASTRTDTTGTAALQPRS